MSKFNVLEAIEHFKAANAELREELKQAYALGIYKGTDGLLRNSWQQRVEELDAENKRLKDIVDSNAINASLSSDVLKDLDDMAMAEAWEKIHKAERDLLDAWHDRM